MVHPFTMGKTAIFDPKYNNFKSCYVQIISYHRVLEKSEDTFSLKVDSNATSIDFNQYDSMFAQYDQVHILNRVETINHFILHPKINLLYILNQFDNLSEITIVNNSSSIHRSIKINNFNRSICLNGIFYKVIVPSGSSVVGNHMCLSLLSHQEFKQFDLFGSQIIDYRGSYYTKNSTDKISWLFINKENDNNQMMTFTLTENIPYIISFHNVLLSAKCNYIIAPKILISPLINCLVVAIPLSSWNNMTYFKVIDV